ncbi:uncharacterized protein LOC114325044 [Diabrotica virgifera virgifera]|uniref:Uncharacterized protein LOC114325044 n=1 Tax=Diabrotica virgifera virgifera TaxID=50390 RepID=A0A6P7EZP8_DIAVI|nr:uncharacterized protein LOC114325044 [Diabrotica virgifera virgifera]
MVLMKIVLVVCCVAVCAVIVGGDLLDEFLKHNKRVAISRYPCKEPQPRVMSLMEVFDDEMWSLYKNDMKNIRPQSTVLHRCDGSGCCKKYNEKCQARLGKEVTLTFLHLSQKKYIEIKATNHTRCVCEKFSETRIK